MKLKAVNGLLITIRTALLMVTILGLRAGWTDLTITILLAVCCIIWGVSGFCEGLSSE